jgi:flagellar FliL protein
MSDADDLNLGDGDAGAIDAAPKKASGLAALLPNLLKFAAIGLGALIFIVTVSVITYNILNKGGSSQTVIPENSPYVGSRPEYSMFTAVGMIRTSTKDPVPYAVVVDMAIGYTMNDATAQAEIIARQFELRDFVRNYFSTKSAADLRPENEPKLKQEIMERLNTQILDTAKARNITFNQLSVMEM